VAAGHGCPVFLFGLPLLQLLLMQVLTLLAAAACCC
jgi:hypothetical protein